MNNAGSDYFFPVWPYRSSISDVRGRRKVTEAREFLIESGDADPG
jgi:hypothetical protein